MGIWNQIIKIHLFFLLISLNLHGANWVHITVGSAPSSTRPVICSDPLGNLHVAWTSDDIYGELVQYATNQPGSWSFQKQVAGSSGNQAYSPSITADREGFGYVVFRYYGSNYEPRYVTNRNVTGNYWNLVRPMSGGHYHEALIEVDSEFQTHVFAQEDTWGSNVYYQKLDVNYNVVIYNITQFYSTTVDQNDVLHFVGHNSDGIFYTYNDGSTWSEQDTIDQIGVSAYQPSITCDGNNHLHVVFASSDGLYYINNSSGIWSSPELITAGGIFPNIMADENGKAHVAWYTQVDYGGIYYSNNIAGSWLSPEYITTINTDGSSATEDAAHVESKIALDPKSNTVSIVYISNNTDVKLAQTSDFNLRRTINTGTNSTLISLADTPPRQDTLSSSAGGTLDMLYFSIDDNGGDGLPVKMNELIILRGPGMSANLCFNDVFSKVTLICTDGTDLEGTIYASKIMFGSLDYIWKEIPDNSSYEFTVSATLKQPLQNMDGKCVQMKVNGLYDIINDPSGSCFDYNSTVVISDTILFQVIPDHYEFAGLGNDFSGENLVEGWFMQLKIVDASGAVATGITGIDVTLSAVQQDGVTPTAATLQSNEGLTKTFSNGIAQWMNITYPDSGQFRILASCSALTAASDTITILPFHKYLLICQPDENMSVLLSQLNIDCDFYSAYNTRYPGVENLAQYETIFLDGPYSIASRFDSTIIKTFLESGTTENRKSILAFGDNALGYYYNSEFANVFFGGRIPNYYQHSATTLQGVSSDPITDGLTLNIIDGYTNTITPNSNLDNNSVVLTFPQTEKIVGVKTAADNYRTVFISANFSDLSDNAQRDSLVSNILHWFQEETQTAQGPELSGLPDFNMTEDIPYKMALADWYPYVSDADTPDENLNWSLNTPSHCSASIKNDTLTIEPETNFYGRDTLIVTVSDGQLSDSDTLLLIVAPDNDPLSPFSLLLPVDEYVTTDTSKVTFSWTPSIDIENDIVKYAIIFNADYFNSPILVDSTKVIIDMKNISFPEEVDIEWTVKAYSNNNYNFVEAENAPFSLKITKTELSIDKTNAIPNNYTLYNNYPNPFNPITSIRYGLPKESNVSIMIFDVNGRLVETLVNQTQAAGYYTIIWQASKYVSGVYFYRIVAGDFQQERKCILIK